MQDQLSAVVELGKYGVFGVMIALILLAAFLAWLLWKLVTNHMAHSDQYMQENTRAQQRLTDTIENWNRAIERNK